MTIVRLGLLVCLLATSPGCELILDFDRSEIPRDAGMDAALDASQNGEDAAPPDAAADGG